MVTDLTRLVRSMRGSVDPSVLKATGRSCAPVGDRRSNQGGLSDATKANERGGDAPA